MKQTKSDGIDSVLLGADGGSALVAQGKVGLEARLAVGLRKLANEKGWTQREWASKADVTENSLSDYLSGKYPPRLDTLFKLLSAGGWSLLDLAKCMEEEGEGDQEGLAEVINMRSTRDSGEMRAFKDAPAAEPSHYDEATALRELIMMRQVEHNAARLDQLERDVRAIKTMLETMISRG